MTPTRITWRYCAVAALAVASAHYIGPRLDAETRAQERPQATTTTTIIDIGTPATLWRALPETR